MRQVTALVTVLCSFALACSTDSKKSSEETAQTWSRIMEADWELLPGGEIPNHCTKLLLTEDTYISAIRPVHPLGTHHTVVTLGDANSSCTGNVFSGVVYAAGVGSPGMTLPPGVAMKLPAGKHLLMGLHLYNTSQSPLTGTSGIEVVTMKPEDVRYESEAVLAGTVDISLGAGEQKLTGNCAITADQTMYALFPHMHQLGTHLKTTFTSGGVPTVIHDGAYDFEEQEQLVLDPAVALHAGDTVTTECTYLNDTGRTVGFGESSDTEMCFSILFRYPPQGSGLCVEGTGSQITLNGPPCAAPGATGNELSIGKECTAGGSECTNGTFCLANVVSGTFGNFCSQSCTTNAECGTGATCAGTPPRTACIPTECLAGLSVGDGGTSDGG